MYMDGLFLFSFLLSFGDRVWIFSSKTIKLIQIIYYDADEEDDEKNDDDEEEGDDDEEDGDEDDEEDDAEKMKFLSLNL